MKTFYELEDYIIIPEHGTTCLLKLKDNTVKTCCWHDDRINHRLGYFISENSPKSEIIPLELVKAWSRLED